MAKKVSDLLNANGYEGQYEIVQCAISEAAANCEGADMLVATTVAPAGITCAYVSGFPFLTRYGQSRRREADSPMMAQ